MRNELPIYRDARGEWRLYWLAVVPSLLLGLLLVRLGPHGFTRDIAYIALGLSLVFQFTGIIHLCGLRTRVLTVSEMGLTLQIDPLNKTKTIELKWDEIIHAGVSASALKESINLLPWFGPVFGSLPAERDVLALDLRSPLPSHVQDLIKCTHKIYFFRGQIGCSKDGKEILVTTKPAGGYYRLLQHINSYFSQGSENDIQQPNPRKLSRLILLFSDSVLASSVLIMNYLLLTA